jgi:sugar phosphate isomerase/epimerase
MTVIGLSLPYDYLCGSTATDSARLLSESFGPAAAALETFRQHGVRRIEIRHFPETVPADLIVRGCRVILRAGLEITLHPATPSSPSSSRLSQPFPWIDAVLRLLAGRQKELLLTLHAYLRAGGEEAQLSIRTQELFRSLADLAEREQAPVRFALEMNREKGVTDPSNSYISTAGLCTRIDRDGVGICWDWGHGFSNVLKGSMKSDPPESFLERVIHTHIHGVGPSGRTHLPLTSGRLPTARYAAALLGRGYRGTFCLELSPERFSSEEPVAPAFLESIGLLNRTLSELENGD